MCRVCLVGLKEICWNLSKNLLMPEILQNLRLITAVDCCLRHVLPVLWCFHTKQRIIIMYHVPRSGLSLLSTVAWFTDFFFFRGYESTINTYVTKSTLLFYTFYKHRINFIIANCITFRTVFLFFCLLVYMYTFIRTCLSFYSFSHALKHQSSLCCIFPHLKKPKLAPTV